MSSADVAGGPLKKQRTDASGEAGRPAEPQFATIAVGAATMAAKRRRGRPAGAGSEDRYAITPIGEGKCHFAGVFDGHGGAEAAEYVSEKLPKTVAKQIAARANAEPFVAEATHTGHGEVDSALTQAFRLVDDSLLEAGIDCGSTGCTVLIGPFGFVCANAGDSRAVLLSKTSAGVTHVHRITEDHKPSLRTERERIEAGGGHVMPYFGVARVMSETSPCMLAVSRSFGDRSLKLASDCTPRTLITEEPDCFGRRADGSEELIVLMSDGVSDVLSDETTAHVALEAARAAQASTAGEAATAAAEAVVQRALQEYSPDDITAVVALLSDDTWKTTSAVSSISASSPTQAEANDAAATTTPDDGAIK